MNIREELFKLQDKEYASFQAKLTPNIAPESFIGVRVPKVRALAKKLYKENDYQDFLSELPHAAYDENMLHGLIISEIKDIDMCFEELERFLPYVDNWAVCDIMSPKVLKKHKDRLLVKIKEWTNSEHSYTCRFGMEMLMSFYLDEDFKPEYLEIPAAVKSEEYYVNMMIAWFFATALTKQWDAAIPYIENGVLDKWTHNKTIQKARESYRIPEDRKEYLKSIKK